MRAWARCALLVAALLALSACTLDLEVDVELESDGSGAVLVTATLDAEALVRAGGDLEAVLALDALRADGWSVDGPTPDPEGGATVRLRQPFDDAAGAEEVFADLAGAGGPFEGLRVERDQSLLETRWRFEGRVDLGRDTPVPGGSPTVDGEPVDGTLEQLEAQLGQSLERLLRVRVGVRLPGDVDSNATTRAENGAVWQVGFGDGPIELEATGRSTRTGMVALLVLGGVVLVVAAVALLIRAAGRSTARAAARAATRSGRAGP